MYSWIDNILDGIKESYNVIDIYDLYDLLEIEIQRLDISNILLRGNESFYHRNFFNREVVFIRDNLNIYLEKFILSHELGHAILHTNVYGAAFNKDLINTGKLEKQANYFAFKLLEIDLNPIDLEGFTLNQIASSLFLPNIADETLVKSII